jgi:hypothetical protein
MSFLSLVKQKDLERAGVKPAAAPQTPPSLDSVVAVAEAPRVTAPGLPEDCGPYTHIAPDVCPMCGPSAPKMVQAKLSPLSDSEVVFFCPVHAITQLVPSKVS